MLEGWCRRWRIKLNASKSNLLVISRILKIKTDDSSVMLFDDIVSPCQNAKFLGIEIDDRLNFNKHFDEKVKTGLTALVLIFFFHDPLFHQIFKPIRIFFGNYEISSKVYYIH